MKEYKTIEEVLKKGQTSVNLPIPIIMGLVWLLSWFLGYQVVSKQFQALTLLAGLFLGFILGWAYWSYKIVKWRIWAFENTKKEDWVELKSRAVTQKLIWPDNSIFEKTEIRTNEEKQIIKNINKEIPQIEINTSLDIIQNDENLPHASHYYFAKSELILNPILFVVLVAFGIYLIIKGNYIIGVLSIALGIYLFNLKKYRNLWNREIQLSISNQGIDMKFENLGLIEWNNTIDIVIDPENYTLKLGAWKNEEFYNINFPLNGLDIQSTDELLRRINVYLKRNQMKMEDS